MQGPKKRHCLRTVAPTEGQAQVAKEGPTGAIGGVAASHRHRHRGPYDPKESRRAFCRQWHQADRVRGRFDG